MSTRRVRVRSMIDIHTHVLPGLDDGSATLKESIEMLRIAAAAGTTDIVATPHANLEFHFDPIAIAERIAVLREATAGIPRLHRGCDFHLYFDNIEDALQHPTKYTINGKSYLMVEFPDLLIAKSTSQVFAALQGAGMIPVITHPERNALLQRRLEELRAWVEQGALLQVTGQSLLGRFGREGRQFSRELIQLGMVHFIASDAHDTEDRTPRLDEAYKEACERFGEPIARALFVDNPRAAITGEPLPEQPAPPPSRKWFQFWAGKP